MKVITAIGFDSQDDYFAALDVAVNHFDEVDESFAYCIRRERGYEAHVLRSAQLPFIAFDECSGEVIDTNVDLEKVDKANARVLLRGREGRSEVAGVQTLMSAEDDKRVEQWPLVIQKPGYFLARDLELVRRDDFIRQFEAEELRFPLFLKGTDKGRSNHVSLRHVFGSREDLQQMLIRDVEGYFGNNTSDTFSTDEYVLKFKQPDWYCPYRESLEKGRTTYERISYDFILSDVMNILSDEKGDNGRLEYRCFVFDGQVTSISRYVDFKSLPVPEVVRVFAGQFADCHKQVLPVGYVVDIAETDKGLQVIELNPFGQSGRYLDNDPLPLYEAVAARHPGDLPGVEPRPLPARDEEAIFSKFKIMEELSSLSLDG